MLDTDPDSVVVRPGGRLDRPAVRRRRAAPLRLERVLAPRSARTAPHPHVERRYLVVPGLRSSRIMVLDTKDDPRQPPVVKVLEAEELAKRAGYSRPHTLHCGPDGIYLTCLGGANGEEGPGGVALLDHTSRSRCSAAWEVDRGPQYLAYDLWWHIDPRRAGHQRVGHPVDDRGRRGRRAAARPQVRPQAALLGPAPKRRHVQDGRPRRPAPDGAGAAPGARPDQVVRVRRRGGLRRGPVRLGLAVAPGRGRRVRGHQGDRRSRPSRPTRPTCRRCCSRSARCRRWSPTSTCPSTTSSSTSPAGAPASSSSTT